MAGSPGILIRAAILAALFAMSWLLARLWPNIFDRFGKAASRVAEHRAAAIAGVALFALAARLAIIPILPLPKPVLPDEFSHLLLAETLAGGRIANPTPAHWQNIENMFVLYTPAYQSKYPLGQAAVLSVGQVLFGDPFFGVWLATAAMCAAICWMLWEWLPAPWAVFGGILTVVRHAVVGDWINTYMGGSVAALGGALALGAVPRLRRQPSGSMAAVFGAGIVIVMHTRPFEATLLFCLLAALWLPRCLREPRVVVALGLTMAAGAAVVAHQNWRVTGNPLRLPYQLAKQAQGVPQGMYWQAPVPQPPLHFRRLVDMYEWQLREHEKGSTLRGYCSEWKGKLAVIYQSYAGYYFLPPLLIALAGWRDWRIRSLVTIVVLMFLWSSQYGYFYEHYFSPLTGAFLILILYGLERMSRWRWRGVPWGACAVLTLGVSAMQATPFALVRLARHPEYAEAARFRVNPRGPVESELTRQGGRHVVFVRSHRGLETPAIWFYNGPSIEDSAVIWAQEIDPATDREFLRHYSQRRVWVVDADAATPALMPYPAGAGRD